MAISQPRISVVILTYNQAHLVERSIQSVLEQSFTNYELILVDNGSADETMSVFQKYQDLENVRVFRIKENIGFTRGLNFCLDQIRCEWFAIVGDDAEIIPDALETLFNVVDYKDPSLTALNCNGLDSTTGKNSGLGLYKDQYLPIGLTVKCEGCFWGMTKTELIKGKRLNPNIPGMENTFWYKVDAIANRYYIHRQLITYHRDHHPIEKRAQNTDLKIKALLYRELLTEPFYWEVLRNYDKKQFRDRCIKAMHFLKADSDFEAYKIYQKMLRSDQPGLRYNVHSTLIRMLPPGVLTRLYFWRRKAS